MYFCINKHAGRFSYIAFYHFCEDVHLMRIGRCPSSFNDEQTPFRCSLKPSQKVIRYSQPKHIFAINRMNWPKKGCENLFFRENPLDLKKAIFWTFKLSKIYDIEKKRLTLMFIGSGPLLLIIQNRNLFNANVRAQCWIWIKCRHDTEHEPQHTSFASIIYAGYKLNRGFKSHLRVSIEMTQY